MDGTPALDVASDGVQVLVSDDVKQVLFWFGAIILKDKETTQDRWPGSVPQGYCYLEQHG